MGVKHQKGQADVTEQHRPQNITHSASKQSSLLGGLQTAQSAVKARGKGALGILSGRFPKTLAKQTFPLTNWGSSFQRPGCAQREEGWALVVLDSAVEGSLHPAQRDDRR